MRLIAVNEYPSVNSINYSQLQTSSLFLSRDMQSLFSRLDGLAREPAVILKFFPNIFCPDLSVWLTHASPYGVTY